MNKKRIFFLVILFLVGLLIAVLLRQTKVGGPKTPGPTPTPYSLDTIQRLPTPPFYKTPTGTQFTVQFSPPQLPEQLATYQIGEPPAVTPIAQSMATRLGITAPPTIIQTHNGAISLWSGPGKTVTAREDGASISYTDESAAVSSVAPDQGLAEAAIQAFLKSNNLEAITAHLSLAATATTATAGDAEGNEDKEPRVSISYAYLIAGAHPLLINFLPYSALSVVVGPDGIIRSLSLKFPGEIGAQGAQYPPIPVALAVESLGKDAGALISYTPKDDAFEGLTSQPVFNRVGLTRVDIAYLPQGGVVRPVYLFTGSVIDTGKEGTVRYVVPATP